MKQKSLALVSLFAVLVLMLSACSSGSGASGAAAPADIGTWTLTVVGPDGTEHAFTNVEAAKLTPSTIDMTVTNKNGEAKTSSYTGVTLASILESLGIKDVNGVTVEAADGFAADYSPEMALADDTLLAWAVDGALIDSEQPLRMCPAQGTGNQFVKDCSKVIVI